jgi:hypothetical protein
MRSLGLRGFVISCRCFLHRVRDIGKQKDEQKEQKDSKKSQKERRSMT